MKPSRYFILIISLLLVLRSPAQSLGEVLAFADQQFKEGHFDIAAKEYNRALFFGCEPRDLPAFRIAQCYFEMGELDLSAGFYDKAYAYSDSNELQNEALLGKAFCLILADKQMLALAELINFNATADSVQNSEFYFLSGIALYRLGKDTLASDQFHSALKWMNLSPDTGEELDVVFQKVFRINSRYSPDRSFYLSLFPGLGQMVIGEVTEGLKSFVLIGLLFVISNQIALAFSFGDAIITILPWLQRYYMGGMEKAKELTVSKIELERYKAYQQILELTTPPQFK